VSGATFKLLLKFWQSQVLFSCTVRRLAYKLLNIRMFSCSYLPNFYTHFPCKSFFINYHHTINFPQNPSPQIRCKGNKKSNTNGKKYYSVFSYFPLSRFFAAFPYNFRFFAQFFHVPFYGSWIYIEESRYLRN